MAESEQFGLLVVLCSKRPLNFVDRRRWIWWERARGSMKASGLSIIRRSEWSFITSGTGGVGLSVVAVSGGTVVLSDPREREQRFRYGAAGVGWSFGIRKIPTIGRLDTRRVDPRGLSDRL
jgi:hypothetical protein